ncbi:hypothetical protein TrRE_jg2327, partial [Triparma retinervis]
MVARAIGRAGRRGEGGKLSRLDYKLTRSAFRSWRDSTEAERDEEVRMNAKEERRRGGGNKVYRVIVRWEGGAKARGWARWLKATEDGMRREGHLGRIFKAAAGRWRLRNLGRAWETWKEVRWEGRRDEWEEEVKARCLRSLAVGAVKTDVRRAWIKWGWNVRKGRAVDLVGRAVRRMGTKDLARAVGKWRTASKEIEISEARSKALKLAGFRMGVVGGKVLLRLGFARIKDRYLRSKSASLILKVTGRMSRASTWSAWHTWVVQDARCRRALESRLAARLGREGGAARVWLWARNRAAARSGRALRTWRHAVHGMKERETRRRGEMKCVIGRLVGGQKYIAFNLWRKNALFDEGMNRVAAERDEWRKKAGVGGLERLVRKWGGRRVAEGWRTWRDMVGREGRRCRGIEKLVQWGMRGERRALGGRFGSWRGFVERERGAERRMEIRRLAVRGLALKACGGGKRWAWNRLRMQVAEALREEDRNSTRRRALARWGRAVTARVVRKAWGTWLIFCGGREKDGGCLREGVKSLKRETAALRMWGVMGGKVGRDLGRGWRTWVAHVVRCKEVEERRRSVDEIKRLAVRGVAIRAVTRSVGGGRRWAWNRMRMSVEIGRRRERIEGERVGALWRWIKGAKRRGITGAWITWRRKVREKAREKMWEDKAEEVAGEMVKEMKEEMKEEVAGEMKEMTEELKQKTEERRRLTGMKVAGIWRRGEGRANRRAIRKGWNKWREVKLGMERREIREKHAQIVRNRILTALWGAALKVAGEWKRWGWWKLREEVERVNYWKETRERQTRWLRRWGDRVGKGGKVEAWGKWREIVKEADRWERAGKEKRRRAAGLVKRWGGEVGRKAVGRCWRHWRSTVEVDKAMVEMEVKRELGEYMGKREGEGREEEEIKSLELAKFRVGLIHVGGMVKRWEGRALARGFRRLVEVLGEWRVEKKIDVEYEYIKDIMRSYGRLQGNVEGGTGGMEGLGGLGGLGLGGLGR